MTDGQKIALVKTLVENDPAATDEVCGVYLTLALNAILGRRYPFGIPEAYNITQYEYKQCELAARYFLRRGGQGEITHNENGVNRTYQSVNDEDILRTIPQIAKVV